MKTYIHKIFFAISITIIVIITILTSAHVCIADKYDYVSEYFRTPAAKFINPDAREFSIAILSDIGANDNVAESVLDTISKTKPQYDFVLFLGDLVDRTNDIGILWMLAELRQELDGLPMYLTPGNHDIYRRKNGIDTFTWHHIFGPADYWFGYGNVLFISLDTSGPRITKEQFDWLNTTLTKIRPLFKHCVIYTHKPPFDVKPEYIEHHSMDKKDAPQLAQILRRHRVDAILAGHVHYWAADTFAGVPLYITPSAGQTIRGDVKQYGYVSMTFDKKGIKKVEPKYINFDGQLSDKRKMSAVKHLSAYTLREEVLGLMFGLGLAFALLGALCWIRSRRKES